MDQVRPRLSKVGNRTPGPRVWARVCCPKPDSVPCHPDPGPLQSELGYGDSGSPPKIKGGDLLIFKMEIIKINGDKVPAMRCDALTLEVR